MRMKNFLLSFKGKLTLLVIAAISLPLLVAALIARQVLQERIHSSFTTELNTGLGTITLILSWIEQDLVAEIARIASNDVMEDHLAQGTVPELKKILTTQRKVVALELLAVFDLHRALVASSKFKSKNLALDFNRLEQLQIVQSGEDYYLIYLLPITRKQRPLGYAAGGILLNDKNLLNYLQTARIANTAFWLGEKLLLTDVAAPADLIKPKAALGEMFEARIAGQKYQGIVRGYQLGEQRLEYALFISTRQLEEDELKLSIALIVVVAVLFTLCLSFLGNILERTIKPLQHLTAYARQLSTNHFTPRVDSALARLAESSHDEVGKLADAFMHMERQLRAYIHELTETTRANERIQSELRIARDIQMSMLPHHNGAWRNEGRFAVAAALEPAREVGGDFYDYFMIDETHLGFAIGDVSGKGIPASLFMAVSKALVRAVTSWARAFADNGMLPREVLERVNHELCRENDMLMFVTLFYGVLETQTGEVIYSSAGHNPPFVFSPHPRRVSLLQPSHSKPLGIKASSRYQTHALTLQAGEMLLLYTDGLTEARDANGQLYSEARLEKFLRQGLHDGAHALLQNTLAEIKSFAHDAPPHDDMTMLALEYLPQKKSAITIRNRLDDLQRLLPQIEEYGARRQIAKEDLFSVRLAVEEMITNTLKYGYGDEAEHDILIQLHLHEGALTIRIEDDAEAFNPIAASSAASNGNAAGGHGLKLVRALMDEWHYQREGDKNILLATKQCRLVLPMRNKTLAEGNVDGN